MSTETSFVRILVVGPTKSGKTSLLACLSHSQQAEYEPTVTASRFTDVSRGFIFVDTPGVDDSVLHQGTRDDCLLRFQSFEDDTLVKELRGIGNIAAANSPNGTTASGKSEFNVFKDKLICEWVSNDLVNIDAVLIVYTEDKYAARTAKALRYAYYRVAGHEEPVASADSSIRQASRRGKPAIFMVKNTGDIRRPDPPADVVRNDPDLGKTSCPDKQKRDLINAIFTDQQAVDNRELQGVKVLNEHVTYLPSIDAIRETGIDSMMFQLQKHLNNIPVLQMDQVDQATADAKAKREDCGSCAIS